jgi:hypothetical protein
MSLDPNSLKEFLQTAKSIPNSYLSIDFESYRENENITSGDRTVEFRIETNTESGLQNTESPNTENLSFVYTIFDSTLN